MKEYKRPLLERTSPIAVARLTRPDKVTASSALTRAAFRLGIATEKSEQHYRRKK